MILKQDNGSKIRINEQSRNQKVNKTKAKQSRNTLAQRTTITTETFCHVKVCTSWSKSIISCVCQRVLNTDTYMKINNCTKIYVASVLKCFGFGGGVIRMKLQLKTNTLIWNTASLNSLRGEGWHPINGVNTTTFMCLSQPKTWISKVICRGLSLFSMSSIKMWLFVFFILVELFKRSLNNN
jgi:hypothetical protein